MTVTDEDKKRLSRVCKHVENDRLIVLVGTGASMGPPANLPSWWALLEMLAKHAEEYSTALATVIRDQMQRDLLVAADFYHMGDTVPPLERASFFRRTFATKKDAVTPLCWQVASLDATGWITTNYDSTLRHALEEQVSEPLGNSDQELESAASMLGAQPTLVQIHGRAAVYPSIVLGKQSYEAMTRRESYRQLLRDVFLNYSVLAIGFSFGDPPFKALLEYVANDLGGAGKHSHLAILPQNSPADMALLQRANFECLLYDSSNGHGYVGDCLRVLRACNSKPAGQSVSLRRASPDMARLVRIFLSLTNRNRGQTYDMVAGAAVVEELQQRPRRIDVIATKLRKRIGLDEQTARRFALRGIAYLIGLGVLEGGDGSAYRLAEDFDAPPKYPALTKALTARLASLDRNLSRSKAARAAALDLVRRVMVVQGMTAARAFASADSPDAYVLRKIVDEAARASSAARTHREALGRAVVEVLTNPAAEVSRELFYLANAAFALETVFLNPTEMQVGETLSWRLYLDSNVLMRAFHPACDTSGTFGALFERLSALGVPLFMLGPFVDEVRYHVKTVGRMLKELGYLEPQPRVLEEFFRDLPAQEQSPILRWFAWGVHQRKWKSYKEFCATARLNTKGQLRAHATRLGVTVEGEDAIRRFDSSARETLWNDLRLWHKKDQYSQGARKLRRAEATQVFWLASLREQGLRAWFLSQDGQLRRALKFIDGGQYAGFVVTPTAWMMRLTSLHWGEVDVAGFSELMWTVPLTTPIERLKHIAMANVLDAYPDLADEHPDWLRDRIEASFADQASLVEADVESSDEDDAVAVSKWAAQVVPPVVDEILDALAAKQEAQQPPTRKARGSSKGPDRKQSRTKQIRRRTKKRTEA